MTYFLNDLACLIQVRRNFGIRDEPGGPLDIHLTRSLIWEQVWEDLEDIWTGV